MKHGGAESNKGKEWFADVVGKGSRWAEHFLMLPPALLRRIGGLFFTSVLILLSGVSFGIRMQDRSCLVMSFILGAAFLLYSFRFARAALGKKYRVLKGTVTKIQKTWGLSRVQRVCVSVGKGKEETLTLQKESHVQVGRKYRFYFVEKQGLPEYTHGRKTVPGLDARKEPEGLPGSEVLPEFSDPLGSDGLLGFEEIRTE